MQTLSLKRRDGAAVDAAAIAAFQEGFIGQAILPGDAAYAAARRIWNASIDKHPGLIARCAGVPDVVRAVRFARDQDLLVAVLRLNQNISPAR